jgi:threonine dehydratase
VAAVRDLGAEVVVRGRSQDEAEEHYRELAASRGLVPVVPFDDPMIIAGQGTVALEILSELPDVEVLLIPLSGGGLLAGTAMAAKSVHPGIHVVGVSLERSPAMLESLKAGRPVPVEERDTVAESLLGGIGVENRYTLAMVERFVDEHLTVSEEEIEDGMFHLFERHRLVVEGAAAVGVGAILHRKIDVKGKRVATVLTGSSVESIPYIRILHRRLHPPPPRQEDDS